MRDTSPLETDFPITIGNKQYTLSFPIAAIWKFEDATKLVIMTSGITKEQLLLMTLRERMEWIIDLLWAGLITRHPDLTREQVAFMVFIRDLATIEAKVVEAFQASLPPKLEEVKSEDDPLVTTSQPN